MVPTYSADSQVQEKEQSREEMFKKFKAMLKPATPAPDISISYCAHRSLWIPERLEFQNETVEVPGKQQFYNTVYIGKTRTHGNNDLLGIISGSHKEAVHAVALEFPFVETPEPYLQDEHLKNATLAALAKKSVSPEHAYDLQLTTHVLSRLCDILIPKNILTLLPDTAPCAHENDTACKEHSTKMLTTLKAAAQASPKTHTALIKVPYLRPKCLILTE